jgi:hypothetical protein
MKSPRIAKYWARRLMLRFWEYVVGIVILLNNMCEKGDDWIVVQQNQGPVLIGGGRRHHGCIQNKLGRDELLYQDLITNSSSTKIIHWLWNAALPFHPCHVSRHSPLQSHNPPNSCASRVQPTPDSIMRPAIHEG